VAFAVPELEARLRARAETEGLSVEAYVEQISADGMCLTFPVSQKGPQSTKFRLLIRERSSHVWRNLFSSHGWTRMHTDQSFY
jgi:hypothetical protein